MVRGKFGGRTKPTIYAVKAGFHIRNRVFKQGKTAKRRAGGGSKRLLPDRRFQIISDILRDFQNFGFAAFPRLGKLRNQRRETDAPVPAFGRKIGSAVKGQTVGC